VGPAHRRLYAVLVGVAAAVAVLCAGKAIWRQTEERLRASGLLAVLAGTSTMAVAIGHARTWYAESHSFGLHYVLVMSVLLCSAYVIVLRYAPPRLTNGLQALLYLLLLCTAWHNYAPGEKSGRDMRQILRAIEIDIHAGKPSEQVSWKCLPIHPSPKFVAPRLEMLRRTRMGPYKKRNPSVDHTDSTDRESP
jgi:hypothetical protein